MSSFLRRKLAQAAAVSAVAMAVGLGPAGVAQASATPAQKVALTTTNRNCAGTVLGNENTMPYGFSTIIKPASGKLVAAVALKNALPNQTYNIRLIQVGPSGALDCTVYDGTLTTDSLGDGNANVQEPVMPGAIKAWVDLNNQANFSQFYTTAPVSFGG